MRHKEKQALLELLKAMSEDATDMYWGECHLDNEEKSLLKDTDYKEAYDEACIDFISELIDKLDQPNWYHSITLEISRLFGKRMMSKLIKREMETGK